MKKQTLFLTLILVGLLSLPWTAQAQTAITQTTLAAAITAGQGQPGSIPITVSSATGMAANGILWIEGSIYRISSVSGTTITVTSIYAPATHLTSAVVYVVPVNAQIGLDPTGSCIRGTAGAFPMYSPYTLMFNTSNGHIASCRGGVGSRTWVITAFAAAVPSANPPVTP